MAKADNPILCPLYCSHLPFASVQAASKHVRRRECPNAKALPLQEIEDAIKKRKKERQEKKSMSCPVCGLLAGNKEKLMKHSRVHQEATFQCQYCGMKFKRKDDQRRHEAKVCNPARSNTTTQKGDPKEIVPMLEGKRVHPIEQNKEEDKEPAHKVRISSSSPVPLCESPGLVQLIQAEYSMEATHSANLNPLTLTISPASANVNEGAAATRVQQDGNPQPALKASEDPSIHEDNPGCKPVESQDSQARIEHMTTEIVDSTVHKPEPPKTKKGGLVSLETQEKSQPSGKVRPTNSERLNAKVVNYRFKDNNNVEDAFGRALAFVFLLLSCLPPKMKQMRQGEEGLAQNKPNVKLGSETYVLYYSRLKVQDRSTTTPMILWFFSRSISHIPPALGANQSVVLAVNNVRCTQRNGVRYLTANESCGWAVFSLAGEIQVSYNWNVAKVFARYLRPVLDDAKAYASNYADKSGLFYYESPDFVPADESHDSDAERRKYIDNVGLMNSEQSQALVKLVQGVNKEGGSVFFIDGPAGTGKTFLIKTFLSYLYWKNIGVTVVASTGLAASLYDEGQTAHHTFGIPLRVDKDSKCHIRSGTPRGDKLKSIRVIVWDEAVSAEKDVLEAVERSLTEFLSQGNERKGFFGGLVVVFSGDFRQILPIVHNKEVSENTIKNTCFWKHLTELPLRQNMRAGEQRDYARFLLGVGNGDERYVDIPAQSKCDTLDQLIDAIYPDVEHKLSDDDFFAKRAILAPVNQAVDEINSSLLGRLPGEEVIYSWLDAPSNKFMIELIRPVLRLKIGSPIMLLVNIGFGLCNGTRMRCEGFGPNHIKARIICGFLKGRVIDITRIHSGQKWQFPIAPCFAMTINKAQGQTFDQAGIYLQRPVFSHGQLYVALSRVHSFGGMKIFSLYPRMWNLVDRAMIP